MAEFAYIYRVSRRATVRRKLRSDIHKPHFNRKCYGIDTEGRFKSQKVGFWRAIWLTYFKTHIRLLTCRQCKRKFTIQARKSQLKAYICARCTDSKDE